ncbi:hypothetical protein [Geoglobus acetivorans]|uniref:Uncharacterized protein n=1 Tax=Geoglobus acetivorans TaxID=565033 RepID=A0ABZ3H414_GEOAI|nr:hypothetical protein [Geoglobus acetivorans]
MILQNLNLALSEGDLEGRTALTSSVMLSISIYLSGFSLYVSFAVIAVSALFSGARNLRLVLSFSPFIALILLSGLFFNMGYAVRSSLAFAGILSTGAIVYSSRISEVAGALLWLRIPQKYVSLIQLALASLPLLAKDLAEIFWAVDDSGFAKYSKVMKAFVSTSVLRSISLSEALYSKNFAYNPVGELRKPTGKDSVLTAVSLLLLLSTVLQVL